METQAALRVAGCDLLVLGTIQGFVPDAQRVQLAFSQHRPDALALGVPPEDIPTLELLDRGRTDHAAATTLASATGSTEAAASPVPAAQPAPPPSPPASQSRDRPLGLPTDLVEPDLVTQRFLDELAAFGATRVPSPDLEAAYRLAQVAAIPIAAVDMDDEAHAELYTTSVRFRHVLRSNARHKRLLRKGLGARRPPNDAYALAVAWDHALANTASLRSVDAERERWMARRLFALAHAHSRLLAIVPIARLDGAVRRLRDIAQQTPGAAPTPKP